jgi:hypothetical protein
LEQGRQSGRTGIEVNAILGVNAVYVPTVYKLVYREWYSNRTLGYTRKLKLFISKNRECKEMLVKGKDFNRLVHVFDITLVIALIKGV